MATTFGNEFLNGYLIPIAAEAAYTVPSSLVSVIINNATVRNYGATPETFTIYMVESGGSADDGHKAVIDQSIAPGETVLLSEIIGEPILSGGSIQAEASTATKLSLTVGGTAKTS